MPFGTRAKRSRRGYANTLIRQRADLFFPWHFVGQLVTVPRQSIECQNDPGRPCWSCYQHRAKSQPLCHGSPSITNCDSRVRAVQKTKKEKRISERGALGLHDPSLLEATSSGVNLGGRDGPRLGTIFRRRDLTNKMGRFQNTTSETCATLRRTRALIQARLTSHISQQPGRQAS